MEWYYYTIIILAIIAGLMALYWFIRSFLYQGYIPLISEIVDPLVQSKNRAVKTLDGKIVIHKRPQLKTGYWNPQTTQKDMRDYIDKYGHEFPEEMRDKENNAADIYAEKMVKKTTKNAEEINTELQTADGGRSDYKYNPKTGILKEKVRINVSWYDLDTNQEMDDNDIVVVNHDFKNRKTWVTED